MAEANKNTKQAALGALVKHAISCGLRRQIEVALFSLCVPQGTFSVQAVAAYAVLKKKNNYI